VRPAFIHANPVFREVEALTTDRDDKGRVMFPAFLLTAHKA
jgi:hypothetical protein